MRIFKNFILTLCIISFFSFGNVGKISDAAYFLPRKQANIAFVGFANSGKTGLRATLAGIPFNFDTLHHTMKDDVFEAGLVVDDGQGQNFPVDCKLWDTSGHPSKKDEVIDFRCKFMDIVVITICVSNQNWQKEVTRNLIQWQNEILDKNPNAKIILACTMCDLINPNLLSDIETAVENMANAQCGLGEKIKSVVLSAKSTHNLDTFMQLVEDDLREIGLDNLRDIHEEIPLSRGCFH